MSNKVKGKQLYMFMDGTPVGCSTDCSLDFSAETVETAGAGNWRTFRAGRKGWNMTCSGFYFEASALPVNFVAGSKAIGTETMVAMTVLAKDLIERGIDLGTVEPNAEHAVVGRAIITSCRYAGSVNGVATYAIDFQGSGDITPMAL